MDGQPAPIPRALVWPGPGGPAPGPFPLKPGRTARCTQYLVLTGPVVRGSALIGGSASGHTLTVSLRLRLTAGQAPAMQMQTAPESALIRRPAGVFGPLRHIGWTLCSQTGDGMTIRGDGGPVYGGQTLTLRPRGDITECSAWQWHEVAGWPGYPAVSIDRDVGPPASSGTSPMP
jgi:hypothetical protein